MQLLIHTGFSVLDEITNLIIYSLDYLPLATLK